MTWIEEFVAWLYRECGIRWPPTEADQFRVIDLLEGVELRWADVDSEGCLHSRDCGATIVLPLSLSGEMLRVGLAHETGHAALTTGMALALRQVAESPASQRNRLSRLWRDKNERIAWRFVCAFFLPRDVCGQYPEHELAELSGIPGVFVRARLSELREEARREEWARAYSAWLREQSG